jgi:hypothetical protein
MRAAIDAAWAADPTLDRSGMRMGKMTKAEP